MFFSWIVVRVYVVANKRYRHYAPYTPILCLGVLAYCRLIRTLYILESLSFLSLFLWSSSHHNMHISCVVIWITYSINNVGISKTLHTQSNGIDMNPSYSFALLSLFSSVFVIQHYTRAGPSHTPLPGKHAVWVWREMGIQKACTKSPADYFP